MDLLSSGLEVLNVAVISGGTDANGRLIDSRTLIVDLFKLAASCDPPKEILHHLLIFRGMTHRSIDSIENIAKWQSLVAAGAELADVGRFSIHGDIIAIRRPLSGLRAGVLEELLDRVLLLRIGRLHEAAHQVH